MTESDPVVRTDGLTKRFGRTLALDELTLSLSAGHVLGFLGPNSAGKTTTLRLLVGHLRPTGGTAWVCGHEVWQDSVAVRRRTGYLPGELRLRPHLTARETVRYVCRLRAIDAEREGDELASDRPGTG